MLKKSIHSYDDVMKMHMKSMYGCVSSFYRICDHVISRDNIASFKTLVRSTYLQRIKWIKSSEICRSGVHNVNIANADELWSIQEG